MDIANATAAQSAATGQKTSTAAESGSGKAAALSSDFQTFLTMLTTQMKNQDPLNPLDSTDFAVQLATFSGVEQQVRTNDLLAELAAKMSTGGLGQFTPWIGMEARSDALVKFEGQPIQIEPSTADAATSSTLVVRDIDGNVVGQAPLPLGVNGPIEWVGTDSVGNPLPNGLYRLDVENLSGETPLGDTSVYTYQRVSEVRDSPDGPIIVMASGALVPAGDVAGVRTPAD